MADMVHAEPKQALRLVAAWAGVPACLLALYLGVLLWRFATPGSLYLSYFTDDFFYYAKVASEIVCCQRSSFNGIQDTNGYHPLWLIVVAFDYWIAGGGKAFFVAITVTIWLLVAFTYLRMRAAQRILLPAAPALVQPAMLVSLTFMAVLARTGMEISIALCFLVVFWERMQRTGLERQTGLQAIRSGLIASCAILGRIDACLAIVAYLFLAFLAPAGRRKALVQKMALFSVGLSPVFGYAIGNRLLFGTLLPISGIAKNLKTTLLPSSGVLERLAAHDAIGIMFVWPSIAIMAFYAVRCRGSLLSPGGRVRAAILLHPLLFFTILSFTSDWPLWTWYLYPLVPVAAFLGPACRVEAGFPRWPYLRKQLQPAVGIVCAFAILNLGRPNPAAVSIYRAAEALRMFSRAHPGIYAMGDRAGTPAYLMDQPVLQMEGLMADLAYVRRIQKRADLVRTLQDLGVRYYVATSPVPSARPGCYLVQEPSKAGPHSPVMKGELCAPSTTLYADGPIITTVFDLHPPRG
jgi:hypothetical protein